MSNDNNNVETSVSFKSLFTAAKNLAADKTEQWTGIKIEKVEKPQTTRKSMAEISAKQTELKAELDLLKEIEKVAKKTEGVCDQIEGLALQLEKVDFAWKRVEDLRSIKDLVRAATSVDLS